MCIGRNRIQPFSKHQQHPNCIKFLWRGYYDCGDPCQRRNAAVMVKTMHQNGRHDILPVLYKVASMLATIPATSCSAERSFSALRRIKTVLRSTMGQERPT